MKKHRNNSHRASALQVALSTGLISISAVFLAMTAPTRTGKALRQDFYRFQLAEGPDADSIMALGNYPDTTVLLSSDTTVTPDATPANTTSINVSTSTDFKGTFAASPITGVITVTDAHPAGTYTVTVIAFGPGDTTTETFALTVTGIPCDFNGFTSAADASVGIGPESVAIGDFNGDGKQDLAVAHYGSGASSSTVSIRLGDGLGGFTGSTEVSVGPGPSSVAIGDFNGDGKQDLAVANYGSGFTSSTVSIRLGDGLGGFTGSTEVGVGSHPQSLAIGDFNRDGKQDLAVANYGFGDGTTVSIRLGDGSGGFSGSTEVGVGSSPRSVAIGDFNGDGKQDLAVARYDSRFNSSTVSIRLGNGLGGFTDPTDVNVGSGPFSIAIGDFNGDGKPDLAVANYFSNNTVSILLGDGSGGFSGPTNVSVGQSPNSIVIGDFNGDGRQDLAVANVDSVSIRLGQCLPGPSPTVTATPIVTPTPTPTAPATVTATPTPSTL